MKPTKKIKKFNEQASLFVGRFQPFHTGHKKLIETVLKQGKPVVIAIRDTEISTKNPLTVTERWSLIQRGLKKYGELVKIVTIPDIDEICYGRDVGYLIRRIHLDGETESISATKIRAKRKKDKPIVWLTGQSGSGKTTLARLVEKKLGGIVLDGDEMRQSISLNAGFSKKDRDEHNLRVARLAKILSRDNMVLVSVIAPFRKTREQITRLIDPVWVYVKKDLPKLKNKPYEEPNDVALIIDANKGARKNTKLLMSFIKQEVLKQNGKT